MSPETRRRIITSLVFLVAGGLILLAFLRPRPDTDATPDSTASTATSAQVAASDESVVPDDDTAPTAPTAPTPDPAASPRTTADAPDSESVDRPAETADAAEFVSRRPAGPASASSTLGSLDPTTDRYLLTFSPTAAGIESIVFSDFWTEAAWSREAARHAKNPEAPMPSDDERYALRAGSYGSTTIPLLAARAVEIDGVRINLFADCWREIEPGRFETEIVDAATDAPVARIERWFRLSDNGYDITLEQRIENVGDVDREIGWIQYGPGDLDRDRGSFIEVRRFHFGYLLSPQRDPAQANVTANGQLYERRDVLDRIGEWYGRPAGSVPADVRDLWPNDMSREQSLVLSWFGTTNRYFTLCVHAPYDPPANASRSVESSLVTVRPIADLSLPADRQVIQTELYGPAKTVAPGESASWNLGVYAGPLERSVLESAEPYLALNMRDLIVYLMSGCCTFCTFSWLADFLVVFLSFLHSIVGDWAIAIILLVCIVRLILHPVMKKGQIQMQRMSRLMTELKPELDALQKKYKDDPARMQSEQRRLFMERGVNPAGCVGGLLPTFLQMPIWIALYAMLFFAFELRQQPAFFGLFQLLPDIQLGATTLLGQFLGDLSRPDHFVEFTTPVDIWITKLTGVNLLPLLMGVIFFIQQKYMSPPPSPNMTPEQLQQQKMMKVMMVVLFPLMLFQAPSGLTLYILTSSSIGIIEGKRIRKHIDGMDLTKPMPVSEKAKSRKARKDQLARMYAQKLEEAKKKQAAKRKGPQKSFKKKD